MTDLVNSVNHVKGAIEDTVDSKSSRAARIARVVDPSPIRSKRGWALFGISVLSAIIMPTVDVLADIASMITVLISHWGGINGPCAQLLEDGDVVLWNGLVSMIIVSASVGTISWLLNLWHLYSLWRLRDDLGSAWASRFVATVELAGIEMSTMVLCTRESGETEFGDRFRFPTSCGRAHALHLLMLFGEDFPNALATGFLIQFFGASTVTIVSFTISVLMLAKGFALFASLCVPLLAGAPARRCRFAFCCFLMVVVAALFSLLLFLSSERPVLVTVRGWTAEVVLEDGSVPFAQSFKFPATIEAESMILPRSDIGFALFGSLAPENTSGTAQISFLRAPHEHVVGTFRTFDLGREQYDLLDPEFQQWWPLALTGDFAIELPAAFQYIRCSMAPCTTAKTFRALLWSRACNRSAVIGAVEHWQPQCVVRDAPCTIDSNATDASAKLNAEGSSGTIVVNDLATEMREDQMMLNWKLTTCEDSCFAASPVCTAINAAVANSSNILLPRLRVILGVEQVAFTCFDD